MNEYKKPEYDLYEQTLVLYEKIKVADDGQDVLGHANVFLARDEIVDILAAINPSQLSAMLHDSFAPKRSENDDVRAAKVIRALELEDGAILTVKKTRWHHVLSTDDYPVIPSPESLDELRAFVDSRRDEYEAFCRARTSGGYLDALPWLQGIA